MARRTKVNARLCNCLKVAAPRRPHSTHRHDWSDSSPGPAIARILCVYQPHGTFPALLLDADSSRQRAGPLDRGGTHSMAFVDGYEYDFFVSYASVDNKPASPDDRGWVDVLVGTLVDELARRLGRREAFTFWMDKQSLRGNHEADEHIPDQVKRSALFLAILSPGYAASTFCQLELESFIASAGGAERLFVVYKERVDEREQTFPDPFRRPVKYEFWYTEGGKAKFVGLPLPNPNDPDDRKLYYPKVL